jgi:hypothetical protein
MHPELKPDVRVAEMQTDLKVLQVLKADAADLRLGATLSLRHYSVIEQGFVNTGTTLRFAVPGAYLLFLVRQPDGLYEPVAGHTFPTEAVYLLDRSDRLPPPPPASLPDMSGTWLLINRSDVPSAAAPELRVTQDARTFDVSAATGSIPDSRTYAIGLIGGVTVGGGDRREWSAIVRFGSLVVETAIYPPPGSAQESSWRSEVWSVGGDRLTIQIKERRGDRAVMDVTLVYRRSGTRRE